MDQSLQALEPTSDDIKMMILADTHLSAQKCEPGMSTYVYGKAEAGVDPNLVGCCLIDIQKTWDKIVLAARVLAAAEDPSSIYCVGQRVYAQRAIIKFAQAIGATAAPGRFTPGQFTNQVTQQFVEPRILVVADPRTDSQAVKESSYVNIPVIAFCGSDSPLHYVDIAVPGNNRSKESLGLLYWMLAREVLRIKSDIPRQHAWEVKVDLFIHKDPEEIDEAEQKAAEAEDQEFLDNEEGYADYDYQDFGAVQEDQQQITGGDPNQQHFAQDWDQGQAPQQWEDGQVNVGQVNVGQGPEPMHGAVENWNDASQYQDQQWNNQPYQQPQQPQYGQPQQQDFGQPANQQFGQVGQGVQGQGYNTTATLDNWDDN